MIKVLHILDSLNRGGAETLALDVCRNFRKAGIDLTFVATGGGDLEKEFERSGTRYFRLQRRLPIDPRVVLKLRRIIREHEIQIVHAHQAVEAIHAYLATIGTGGKRVLTVHNYLYGLKNRIATKLIVSKMDLVFAVSRFVRDWFKNTERIVPGCGFSVLVNGVDMQRLDPVRGPEATTLREELGIPANIQLIGMVGNFYADRRKDQLTICRALPRVFESFPEARFVFVGNVGPGAGDYFDECREQCDRSGIADMVLFAGQRADIPDILRELDLFVFSSVQEGLPIAGIEALLLGVPMLVSDIPPLLELGGEGSEEGRWISVFRTGDTDDLSRTLVGLLNDKVKLRELGEDGRRFAQRYFTIEAHLGSLVELYRGMLGDD